MMREEITPRWRNVVGSMLAWGLDAYDFVAYSFVAPIISTLFFEQLGKLGSILATLLTFSLSLVIRPVGGVFFGNLADKVGRRQVLFIAMLGAGIASFLMGFLPTYEQAGWVGVTLLVLLRAAVGFFMGGQYSSSGVLAVESVIRWRGLASGIMQAGFDVGIFGVTFVYTLVATYMLSDLYTLGWRIVFWSGIITTIVALLLNRFVVTESFEWKQTERIESPYKVFFIKYWTFAIVILLATMGFLYSYYVMLELSPFILQTVLNYTPALAGLILTVLSASDALGSIIGGIFVDVLRSSSKALVVTALIELVLIVPVTYVMLFAHNGWFVLLWDFIAVLPVGVMQVYIRDLLPANVRSTGAGLGYNGGTWLAAWAAPITTLMAGASSEVEPWFLAIVINTIFGSILMIVSFLLVTYVILKGKSS